MDPRTKVIAAICDGDRETKNPRRYAYTIEDMYTLYGLSEMEK